MPDELAVALLSGEGLAAALAERSGHQVVATTPDDHLEVAERLGHSGAFVVGLAPVPWPTAEQLHAACSSSLPSYTGVVAWHGLPLLLDELAQAVAPAVRAGAHLLVTAPDPSPTAAASELIFLREVAEGVAARLDVASRSIAWRGSTRQPTAVSALTSLAQAHGRTQVVECPVAPGTGPDPRLAAEADRLGIGLTCADLGRGSQLQMLAGVIDTVADHEAVR